MQANARARAIAGYIGPNGTPGTWTEAFGGRGSYTAPGGTYGSGGTYGPSCTRIDDFCMGALPANCLQPLGYSPMVEPIGEAQAMRYASAATGDTEYNPATRQMKIYNFRATLRLFSYDHENEYSAITLNLTNSDSDESDELISANDDHYRQRMLAQSRALLNNGRLSLDGPIQDAEIVVKDSSGIQVVYITAPVVTLLVNEEVEPDNIVVSVGSDTGNWGYGISEKYKPGVGATVYQISAPVYSQEMVEFASYPNPSPAQSVQVAVELASSQSVSLLLYDDQYNVVQSIYTGTLGARARRIFTADLTRLRRGVYYLRLVVPNRIYTRRLIIN